MVFNSLHFAAFFAVVFTVVSLLRNKVTGRNAFLLVCGYYFYGMWDWRFLGMLWFTTLFDYFCGRMLGDATRDAAGKAVRSSKDRAFLIASLVINLGVLSFFKYFNFFIDSLGVFLERFGLHEHLPVLRVIAPLGVSFYTFQSISYVVDVYRGLIKSERNLLTYATFVAFFPPLVAGPIERASHLLPQLQRPSNQTWERICQGTYLIGWGLFKKVVIADNIADVSAEVFKKFLPEAMSFDGNGALGAGITAWIGMYAFAIQIYCDFSGYTDIARGVARCMGFELALNFDLPYFSVNPGEFWRKWHISLSSWLRDYLYIPLGGNRKGNIRTYVNLMLTMLLGGLWHGAAWTFVVWGAYQGMLLCVHRAIQPTLEKAIPADSKFGASFAWRAMRVVFMFHLICIGWLFFRAETMKQAWVMLKAALTSPKWISLDPKLNLTLLVCFTILLVVQLAQAWKKDALIGFRLPIPLRAVAYAAILLGIVIFGDANGSQFIYFQF